MENARDRPGIRTRIGKAAPRRPGVFAPRTTRAHAQSRRGARRFRRSPTDKAPPDDAAIDRASTRRARCSSADTSTSELLSDSSAPSAMQLVEIKVTCARALHAQGLAQHLGRNERIAVAIPADPASHPQERRNLDRAVGRIDGLEIVLHCAEQTRNLVQKGVIVIGQPVRHFVEHRELGPTQHAGLPQRVNRLTQPFIAAGNFLAREPHAFAPVQQIRNLHFAIKRAFAPHLGRVGGQHRTDQGAIEEVPQRRSADTGVARAADRMSDGSGTRRCTGERVRPCSANMMLILGNVGEMGEVTERPHDPHRLSGRQIVQERLQRVASGFVVVAMEANRQLPNTLDDVEDRLSFALANGVAENSAEQPDVVTQGPVLVGACIRNRLVHGRDRFCRHDCCALRLLCRSAKITATTVRAARPPRRSGPRAKHWRRAVPAPPRWPRRDSRACAPSSNPPAGS